MVAIRTLILRSLSWDCKPHLVSLIKYEGPSARCCHQSLWFLQEPPMVIRNLVEWTGGFILTRETCMVQSTQCPEERKRDSRDQWRHKFPTLTPSTSKSMLSGWQRLGQQNRNSPQYPQMVVVFSISPIRWTTQTRTLLEIIVYTMMLVSLCSLTNTRWRHSARLIVEFEWPSNKHGVPPPSVSATLICKALSKMKCS